MDTAQTGTVNKALFQQACEQAGVSLSNDEVRRVGLLFHANGDPTIVDYVRMSQELNLHYHSLNYVTN